MIKKPVIAKSEDGNAQAILTDRYGDKYDDRETVTAIFLINGIYGKCKYEYRFHFPMTDEEHKKIDILFKQNYPNPTDRMKFYYSYETTDDVDRMVTMFNKNDTEGLPSWLSEDEYYKMCQLQQNAYAPKCQIKCQVKLASVEQ